MSKLEKAKAYVSNHKKEIAIATGALITGVCVGIIGNKLRTTYLLKKLKGVMAYDLTVADVGKLGEELLECSDDFASDTVLRMLVCREEDFKL